MSDNDAELDSRLREILPPELLDAIGAKEDDFYPAIKSLVREARLDELDQLWLSSCERGCKKCDFKRIMTCNGPNNKDITVVERRKGLRGYGHEKTPRP